MQRTSDFTVGALAIETRSYFERPGARTDYSMKLVLYFCNTSNVGL